MNRESANAMLKTLEEPPPGTLILLLTERAHGVLPTILSRCQTVRFPLLPPKVVAAELCGRFDIGVDAELPAGIAAAAASGSIGIAINEYENPLDEYFGYAASLWNDCLNGDWAAAAAAADALSSGKDAYNACRGTVDCLIRLMRTVFLKKFGRGGASMIYIAFGAPDGMELPDAIGGADELSAVVRLVQEAINGLDARGNPALVMASLVCSLTEALNVEKQ
jgi:hypothetical protein